MDNRRSNRLKRPRSSDELPPPEQPPATKMKYKMTLEQVIVKKKPLKLVHDHNPPKDYPLVKYGNAEFTKFCVNLARKEGLQVWTAQENDDKDKKNKKRRPASRGESQPGFHVSRVGYHFPPHIVKKACNWFEMKLSNDGSLHLDKAAHRQRLTEAEMRDRIMEIYPNLPHKERAPLIYRLEQGPGIGKAKNMNPYKMVELAVISHVRHKYTDYDKLLRQGFDRFAARKEVSNEIRKVLLEWKGEDEADEWDTEFKELIDLTEEIEEDDYSPPTSVSAPPAPAPAPPPVQVPAPLVPPPPKGYHVALRPLPPDATVIDLSASSPVRSSEHPPTPVWMQPQNFNWPPLSPPPQHGGRIALRRLSPTIDGPRSPPRQDLSRLPPPPPHMSWRRLSPEIEFLGARPASTSRKPPTPPPPTARWVKYTGGKAIVNGRH